MVSSLSTTMASIAPAFLAVNTPASIVPVKDHPPLRDLVRQARDARGLTQTQLAEAVEMSQRWVSALENDEIDAPRLKTLHRLSDALHLDLTDLVIAASLARTKAEARRLIASEPDEAAADERRRTKLIRMLKQVNLDRYDRAGQLEDQLTRWMRYDREHPEGV